jgi:hypothetical protein
MKQRFGMLWKLRDRDDWVLWKKKKQKKKKKKKKKKKNSEILKHSGGPVVHVYEKGSRKFKDIPFPIKGIRLGANIEDHFQVRNTNMC